MGSQISLLLYPDSISWLIDPIASKQFFGELRGREIGMSEERKSVCTAGRGTRSYFLAGIDYSSGKEGTLLQKY